MSITLKNIFKFNIFKNPDKMFSKINFVSKIFPKYLKSSHYHKVDKNNSRELTLVKDFSP